MGRLKNFIFRVLHGFRGYPKKICGIECRIDESLRRYDTDGEEEVQEILKSHLKSGDFYIDIGANVGLHVMLAAHYLEGSGKIFAFEPVPTNLRLLKRNLKLNRILDRCEIFQCALTATGDGEIEMTVEPGFSPAASLAENFDGEKVTVLTRTLDECLEPRGPVPALIKIDVEGAEHEVLKGATETLRRGPTLLIEVHTFALPSFGSSPEAINQFLAEFGYVEEALTEMESHLGEYYHALYRVP